MFGMIKQINECTCANIYLVFDPYRGRSQDDQDAKENDKENDKESKAQQGSQQVTNVVSTYFNCVCFLI